MFMTEATAGVCMPQLSPANRTPGQAERKESLNHNLLYSEAIAVHAVIALLKQTSTEPMKRMRLTSH